MQLLSPTLRHRRSSDQPLPVPVAPRRDPLLEAVVARECVSLLFQPQVDMTSGRIVGAEALARWDGSAGAEQLFARAAAAGLSERLSRLVQRKALRRAGAWEGPLRTVNLSINLLPEDLQREGYEAWLLDEIYGAGLEPSRVTVEITENALLSDHPAVGARLATLRAAGVRVAVDDFGTGYASLAYLTCLPLDCLKLDRGLVTGLGRRRGRIVVEAIVRLAGDLGLTVIAEGVETQVQRDLLAGWGCDLFQGYLAAAPLDDLALGALVAGQSSGARAA